MRYLTFVTSIAASILLAGALAPALMAEKRDVDTRTFTLDRVGARDAMTLLRALAGTKNFEIVDDRTFEATDTPQRLDLAAEILSAIDQSEHAQIQHITTEDGSVVALIPLGDLPVDEGAQAARELAIRHLGFVSDLALLVVRDRPEQVTSLIEILEDLQSGSPD